MSGANLTLPQDGHDVGTDQRFSPLASVPFPLLTDAPHVRFGSSHVSTLTCLGWCNVH